MAYIPDLQAYTYDPAQREYPDAKLLAVGWLDARFPYTKGRAHPEILDRLIRLKVSPVNLTRGFHMCPFCEYEDPMDPSVYPDRRGNGEIHIPGENGVVYATPVLICHYIEKHEYLPPQEFLDAVKKFAPSTRSGKIIIVAALERELRPLIKDWACRTIEHEGRKFTFYESSYAVAVCSGIGFEAGRRAAQAAIFTYSPELLISVGVAGALVPELRVGETIFPSIVIDARDSSRHETAIANARLGNSPLARTVVVSAAAIAGAAQKERLGKAYGAHAVDMEGAAVARAAQVHGLPFLAIKTISDDLDFDLPEMASFVHNGQFEIARFAVHVLLRPWLWLAVARLARNTRIASENLCAWLRESALTNTIVPGTASRHQS